MTDSASAASNVTDDLAPWWAWGYVLAMPFALLTLVTPWFSAVMPSMPDVIGSDQQLDYRAWSNFPIGLFGPFWLVMLGGQWYSARRHWRRPPGPSDWRPWARGSARQRSAAELNYPYATGAWYSIGMAAASLTILGIGRALFRPRYETMPLIFNDHPTLAQSYPSGKMLVHAGSGCWFFLIAVGLFVVTSGVGLLLSARKPSWEPTLREEQL
ncbi:MAG: hypothetical protein HOV87_33170 [Catenulispora sp.]|nr:hypothetical protein [Catenulispora sp.]